MLLTGIIFSTENLPQKIGFLKTFRSVIYPYVLLHIMFILDYVNILLNTTYYCILLFLIIYHLSQIFSRFQDRSLI